jgi:hypothetical protein
MSATLTQLLSSNPVLAGDLLPGDGLYVSRESQSGTQKDGAMTAGELAKALFGGATSANASGDTTITPGKVSACHTEVTAITGAGSTTRRFVLSIANAPQLWARLIHRLNLPTTANITIEWHNATVGGALVTSMITDGSGDDAVVEFYFDGTAWQFLRFTYPANP